MEPRISINIRAYETEDLDKILAVFRRSIREIASADYAPAQIEAWSRVDRAAWAEQWAELRRWVAWAGDRAAGFVDLGRGGHLDKLYVDPDHRRRGVARALLKRARTEAIIQGVDLLHTEASLTARPFFETEGFRVAAEETVCRNGQIFRRFRMHENSLRMGSDPR